MSAPDLAKIRPGDLVLLRQSRGGSKAGLHWVAELVDGGMVVWTLTSWPQRFTAPLEDVVRCYRGLGDADVTLAPRLEPKVEAAAPAPEPEPEQLVTISVPSVPGGKPRSFSFPTRQNPKARTYTAHPSDHWRREGTNFVIDIAASEEAVALRNVDGSYVIGAAELHTTKK